MRVHVLLNSLSELGKRDKMRDLPSILSLFRNDLNKFNYTRARTLDSAILSTFIIKLIFLLKTFVLSIFSGRLRQVLLSMTL